MRASIQVANFTWPGGDPAIGSTLAEIGRAADEGGFDTLWVMDHFFQLEPMLAEAEKICDFIYVLGETDHSQSCFAFVHL